MSGERGGIAWKIGWNSYPVVIFSVLFVGGFGAVIQLPSLFLAGIPLGVGISWWGIRDVNTRYESSIGDFIESVQRRAERQVEGATVEPWVFAYEQGTAPFGVRSPKRVHASFVIAADDAIHVTKGIEYDLQSRSITDHGVDEQHHYDQIASVTSQKVGSQRMLRLRMTSGEDVQVQSGRRDISDAVTEISEMVRTQKSETPA